MKYIIGTRGSKLALVQADHVRGRLADHYPEDEFEIKIITTKGDRIQDRPLNQIGDKGLFVKEIEEQLLNQEVHIGVHSMKDMPAFPAEGLVFTKSWGREDPRDVLILREKKSLMELKEHAVIGTGSLRRSYQLRRLRPDLQIVDIRGNVDTRLRKMEEQQLDGIVLAAAGLKRLGMENVITQYLESDEMISAPAQGVLALEVSSEEVHLIEMLDALSDDNTDAIVTAERGFLAEIGGDCHVPIGAVCKRTDEGELQLKAMFGDESGAKVAYSTVTGSEPELLARQAAAEIRSQLAGTVYLIGAGPGDPGLITVKGMKLLQEADCVIYDRLSSPELLADTRSDCERIYVGKENHHHTMIQDEINQLLVDMSMKHGKVVRLKGGDVYVFGRGGEEGMFLREHGVPFEVVPGISSALAGLAYAGIPITHRGVAMGFHVVTAHNRRDELADIDFEAMADGRDTAVFLMGLSKAGEIADRLMQAGMAGETLAAAISHATTAEQKTCVSTLERLAEDILTAGLTSPALIVVGRVVSLREELNFFETRPLFGRRYLVPRIGEQKSGLALLLREKGASVREIQVGKIRSIAQRFTREELREVNWLFFTSRHGVQGFFDLLLESGLDMRSIGHIRIAAIGRKTAEALLKFGIHADLIPAEYHSTRFVQEMKDVLTAEDQVWYLKAANADQKIKNALEEYCNLREIPVYENVRVEQQEEISEEELLEVDNILFTCGSSVERLLEGRSMELLQKLEQAQACIAIGPQCGKALEKTGITKYQVADEATYDGIVSRCCE